MKRLLPLGLLLFLSIQSFGQITITSSDMPVAGDTLRYSYAVPYLLSIDLGDTGAGKTWDFTGLIPVAQGVDTYRTATDVSAFYAFTLHPGVYGYKVADSIPGLGAVLPVSVTDIYTFFKNSSDEFRADAFGATISGFPVGFNYDSPDVWYYFPLSYGNSDSSDFLLNISVPTVGGIKEQGYRKTHVDAWGTIVTPYYGTPMNCVRVRSEVHQIDSVTLDTISLGIPMVTVDYKWLINGEHYPALWVTTQVIAGTEIITETRYRDIKRSIGLSVGNVANEDANVCVAPNPMADGISELHVPPAWERFTATVFDMQGRLVKTFQNNRLMDLQAFPAGQYLVQVVHGDDVRYLKITK